MGTKKAKSKKEARGYFKIYLSNGKTTAIGGTGASFDVRDGALLFFDKDKNTTHTVAPGEWRTVNVDLALSQQ